MEHSLSATVHGSAWQYKDNYITNNHLEINPTELQVTSMKLTQWDVVTLYMHFLI